MLAPGVDDSPNNKHGLLGVDFLGAERFTRFPKSGSESPSIVSGSATLILGKMRTGDNKLVETVE